ncbi:perlwapin-like [Haliotis rufescens]|uniref:perlwapin-like n=1 Tax=Haliotis rufescens TaxID=6454 RepID=UPI00201EC742|nr:perlwapin-like [Haliotis rufescens]
MAGPILLLAITLLATVVSATLPSQPPSSCAAIHCGPGTACQVQTIFCITTPCPPPVARCVPTNKPGSCPVQDGLIGACVVRCNNDADCFGNQKCCGSCPRQCTDPAPPLDKPGFCPYIVNPYPGYCPVPHRCRSDFDCYGRAKCCGSCPRRCASPYPFFTKG